MRAISEFSFIFIFFCSSFCSVRVEGEKRAHDELSMECECEKKLKLIGVNCERERANEWMRERASDWEKSLSVCVCVREENNFFLCVRKKKKKRIQKAFSFSFCTGTRQKFSLTFFSSVCVYLFYSSFIDIEMEYEFCITFRRNTYYHKYIKVECLLAINLFSPVTT